MSPAEHLRPLEPLIGRWRRSGFILDDDGSTPRARCATASGRRGTKLASSRGWARSHDRALGTRGQRPVGSVDEDAIRPGLDSRLSALPDACTGRPGPDGDCRHRRHTRSRAADRRAPSDFDAAAWGVPAHVTVLHPFVSPTAITLHTSGLNPDCRNKPA
jgi:hypothetical protein